MGHLSHHKAHQDLQARLDQLPASFPDTPEGMAILRLLFTEEEAALVARLPFRPRTARAIARRLRRTEADTARLLDHLADRGLIVDLFDAKRGRSLYCVAPAVVGFFEYSMMRRRQDLDQGALARAYETYFDSAGNLAATLYGGPTTIGRTLVHESTLDAEDLAQLLTYERASEVVASASAWAVSLCYCRHKAEHLGHACSAPLENCLTLDGGAQMLTRHGHARSIERTEALEILDRSRQASLVFIGDNVQRRLTYICSCCGCCCMQLRAITRHGIAGAVKTSSVMATIDGEKCTGCGRCARRCPVQAIQLAAWPRYVERKHRMHAVVDEALCLGCGVCQPACKKGALRLRHRGERVLTPEGTFERVLSMALERDRLQHLLFDDQEGLHLLLINRMVGAVLRLPPVKQALLGERLRSRFIGFLMAQSRR